MDRSKFQVYRNIDGGNLYYIAHASKEFGKTQYLGKDLVIRNSIPQAIEDNYFFDQVKDAQEFLRQFQQK